MNAPAPADFRIEPLAPRHERSAFSCGAPALDRYLCRQAIQDVRKHAAAVFVLTTHDSPAVRGFYTLSATTLRLSDLPEDTARKLPQYPLLPAILLGRLAIDRPSQGQGFGELLLLDAFHRCLSTRQIGWIALVVDAMDENALKFYESYQFIRFPAPSLRLFLPRATLAPLIE